MNRAVCGDGDSLGLVGDPVDVVTGANLDRNLDLKLVGPLPFEWHRYYNSKHNGRLCPLGWGHTHEYDRQLAIDVDGLSYTTPRGKTISFPPLESDGDECARGGVVLRRVANHIYRVREHGKPSMEFAFRGSSPVGRLARVFQGTSSISFQYAAEGPLEAVVDSQGRTIHVGHDQVGRVLELLLLGTRPGEVRRVLSCSYDEAGNLVQCVDPYGNRFSFRYDHNNRMVSKTDRRGYSFYFEYDEQGHCIHSYGEDGLCEVRVRYLPKEGVSVVNRANGGEWTYFYKENGAVTKIVDPYGGARTFMLDKRGRVAQEIDPNENVTKWVYGRSGELIGKRSSLGQHSPGTGDPVKPDQKPHPIPSQPSEWEYGRLLVFHGMRTVTGGDSAVAQLPEAIRKLIQEAQKRDVPPPGSTQFLRPAEHSGKNPDEEEVYDDFGLLIREAGVNGTARRWAYDAAGNAVKYRDHDGSTYGYEYASSNLPRRRIDPMGHVTSYSYTPTVQIAKVSDPGGTTSEYVYDLKGRLVQVRRGGTLKEEYRYDKADNLSDKLDSAGKPLLTFEIGPHNLKAVRHLSSGEIHRFAYDKDGRFAELATKESRVRFDYDIFGNRTLDQRDGLGAKHEFLGPGQLSSSTVFDRFTVNYRRLPDGTILITDPGGGQHSVRLLGEGMVLRTMSNGSSELTRFDAAGRCLLKATTRHRSFATPWTRAYSYSGEGDLLQVEDSVNGTIRYEYDAAHRLSRAVNDKATHSYKHDAAGNLLEQPGLSGVSLADGNRLRTANRDEFEYDHRHHIAARSGANGETHYYYDSRDMLVRCESPHGEWRAQYDPLGRRTNKFFGANKVDFYWDTDRLAAEVHEDSRVRIYIYADAFAMTPLLFMEYENVDAEPSSGSRYVVFSNHIGAPIRIEDEQGNVAWSASLDPYGRAHISDGARIEMPLRFPGHYFDAETGLHYNRFRYYSPELGRYLQSDPIGIAGGLNLYAYTLNPLRWVDVRGLAGPPCDNPPPKEPTADPSAPEEGTETEGTSGGGTVQALKPVPPKPVPLADAERTVADALDAAGVGKSNTVRVFQVATHADGSVSVGLSGGEWAVESARNRVDLPPNYRIGPADAGLPPLATQPTNADGTPFKGDSTSCAEPRLKAATDANPSPIVQQGKPVWRGDPAKNYYPAPNPDGSLDPTRMVPCPACKQRGY